MSLDADSHVLLYLSSRPHAHLKKGAADGVNHPLLKLIGTDHKVKDQEARLTIKRDGEKTTVIVNTTGNPKWGPPDGSEQKITFVSAAWDWKYKPKPADQLTGTLYVRGSLPKFGHNKFYIQEFPPIPPNSGFEKRGRINIEFWNDDLITGVFKTDADNDPSGNGEGEWSASD